MNLADLIRTAKGDRSYDQLARDSGGKPSAARLQQIATIPLKNFPDPPTIRSLARGLRVTESAVVLAAAESLGLDVRVSGSRLTALLPAGVEDLTDDQVTAVLGVIQTMLRATSTDTAPAEIRAIPVDDAQLEEIRFELRHAREDVAAWEDSMPDTAGGRKQLAHLRAVVRDLEAKEDALRERRNTSSSETSL